MSKTKLVLILLFTVILFHAATEYLKFTFGGRERKEYIEEVKCKAPSELEIGEVGWVYIDYIECDYNKNCWLHDNAKLNLNGRDGKHQVCVPAFDETESIRVVKTSSGFNYTSENQRADFLMRTAVPVWGDFHVSAPPLAFPLIDNGGRNECG